MEKALSFWKSGSIWQRVKVGAIASIAKLNIGDMAVLKADNTYPTEVLGQHVHNRVRH